MVEIIPLSTGCLGSCTYCKTRHARGKLGSYQVQAIVDRARAVLKVRTPVAACMHDDMAWHMALTYP